MAYIQKQKVTESTLAADERSGGTVSTDGKHFVSITDRTTPTLTDFYFYERDASSNLVFNIRRPALGTTTNSIRFSRDVLLIGCPFINSATNPGLLATFEENARGENQWGDGYVLNSPSGDNNDDFGISLDVSSELGQKEDLLVVGAPGKDLDQGSIYIYEGKNNSWKGASGVEVTPDIRIASARFGNKVTIAGSYVIVSAYNEDNGKGSLYVFLKSSSGVWEQKQKIYMSESEDNDNFGFSLEGHGDFFIAGAPNESSSSEESRAGAAYIFENVNGLWELSSRIVSSDATDISRNLESDFFGYSVDISDNIIAAGSYGARGNQGIVDVYSKDKGWNYLKTLTPDDSVSGDQFGFSVSVARNFVFVGAPGVDDVASNGGAAYFFEDKNPALRLAQEFDVNQEFVPAKASVYLKRSGSNTFNYYPIENDIHNVIDATNFQSISQSNNKVIFNDEVSGFTDNGYMQFLGGDVVAFNGTKNSDYSTISYPIQAVDEGKYNLWLRCRIEEENPSASRFLPFTSDILIDNVLVTTVSENIIDNQWIWVKTSITLPDNVKHNLGIRIKGIYNLLDKILITADDRDPFLDGPETIVGPFVTIHMKLYEAGGSEYPVNPLYIYDYKNTIDEVIKDNWYNFNLRIIDDRLGFINESDFPGNYFLVLSTSGNSGGNYIAWEMVDNDEYMSLFSAIKY